MFIWLLHSWDLVGRSCAEATLQNRENCSIERSIGRCSGVNGRVRCMQSEGLLKKNHRTMNSVSPASGEMESNSQMLGLKSIQASKYSSDASDACEQVFKPLHNVRSFNERPMTSTWASDALKTAANSFLFLN